MEPLKPMAPMKPMTPLVAPWWDESLGTPDAAGTQDTLQYAYFARSRRLLVRKDGSISTYDTGGQRIFGVAQSSDDSRPRFVSDRGDLELESLRML